MTRRALGVIALTAICLAAGLVTGRSYFFNLTYIWGALLLVAALWSINSRSGVQFTRTPGASRTQVGHLFSERYSLTNTARLAKLWVVVDDGTDMPGYRATSLTGLGLLGPSDRLGHKGTQVIGYLAPGETSDWRIRTVCTSRGRFSLGPTDVHLGDPFGLFPHVHHLPARDHVVVLPAVVPVDLVPLRMGRRPGGEALRRRTHQVTPNASGIRPYLPGDSLNRIHWRSSAKWDELIVKEFEVDPLADVWIVLDGFADVQSGLPEAPVGPFSRTADPATFLPPHTEEYAISIAASLIVHFAQLERDVGLIAYGETRHVFQPARGQAHLQRLLEALAVIRLEGDLKLDEVLRVESMHIPRDAGVLLITPDVSPAIFDAAQDLSRLGRLPGVILLDAYSFGGEHGSRALFERVSGVGIPSALVEMGAPLRDSIRFTNALGRGAPQGRRVL